MQTACTRDVDDGPVIGAALDAHIWGSRSNESEGRANVDLHDDIERVVLHHVQHFVECEAGCTTKSPRLVSVKLDHGRENGQKNERIVYGPLLMMWLILPYFLKVVKSCESISCEPDGLEGPTLRWL